MKRLPSLAILQTFDAAARHLNFSRAGEELSLTHSAVSRHVAQLESRLGMQLFARNGPRIALTVEGEALRQRLAQPLMSLHDALGPAGSAQAQTLHIHTLSSFTSAWLMPRLAGFQAQWPQITLSIHTSYDMVSLPPDSDMVAIRYGLFDPSGLYAEKLCEDALVPVATAAWFQRYGNDPALWPASQLLRHVSAPWPGRLGQGGKRGPRVVTPAGLEANDAIVLLDAAEASLGVAWARVMLAAPRLEAARLLALHEWQQPSGKAWWLVCRPERAERPSIRAWRDWLQKEFRANSPSIE